MLSGMSNRKATFAKRQREMDLKDHARAKNERRLARQTDVNKDTKGPQIAWDEIVTYTPTPDAPQQVSDVPTDDSPTSSAAPPSNNNSSTP